MQSSVCQFLDLPFELRLMIWKFALRPLDHNRPGAHFFSLAKREDGDEAIRRSALCKAAGNDHCSGFHFLAPKLNFSKGSRSWTNNNPSAYLWDFGMWTACRESRQVIEAHYSQEDYTMGLRRGNYTLLSYSQASISLNAVENNEEWRFLFDPKQDLVCLQAFDPRTICLWHEYIGENICVTNIPFGVQRLISFGHVAIEYDPSWNDIVVKLNGYDFWRLHAEKSARGFFIRTLAAFDDYSRDCEGKGKRKVLWLIDHSLKRVRYCNKNRKERKVFYGNGQTYTEVEKSLSRRNFSSGGYSSAFDFLDKLDMLLDGGRPSHCNHGQRDAASCYMCSRAYYGLRPYQIHRHVSVLMCENSA
ncbi:hypothetical protein J3F84DRAFT_374646 [Trichoderma pleuroticola]